jgi:hypothetical protein
MKDIILYSLGIVWYFFSTVGFYYLTTKEITQLKLKDKILIFILSLFFPLILGALGFASIMVKIEEKIKGY